MSWTRKRPNADSGCGLKMKRRRPDPKSDDENPSPFKSLSNSDFIHPHHEMTFHATPAPLSSIFQNHNPADPTPSAPLAGRGHDLDLPLHSHRR
ncbi:hypothetical protein GBA52_019453 [Prunus armeniaca]|nr:hypothetical protein GBA52_019453 [Prunus armeniaca]